MRIACFVNNWLGWKCVETLRAQGEEIVALVVHPEAKRKFGEEILQAAGVPAERVFTADRLRDPVTIDAIARCGAEMAVSILFGYILKRPVIRLFPSGVVNLHPSLLPYNRGACPNVWSIVDGTPAGVTLHYIDEGVDTGDIVAQHEVPVAPTDTGKTLYRKLEQVGLELFREQWPRLAAGKVEPQPQPADGTAHRTKDLAQLDCIDLDKSYPARYLIDVLRARTFSPYSGAYFEENGRRVFLRLELFDEQRPAA